MEKVHRDKKEYASKAVGGTALGLSIGALGLQLLGGGLLNGGLFGNRASVAETAAIAGTAANEHYLERKQCADQVQFVNDMWRSTYAQQNHVLKIDKLLTKKCLVFTVLCVMALMLLTLMLIKMLSTCISILVTTKMNLWVRLVK